MSEDENMALIAAYGINTPQIAVATTRDEARAAASDIGGPVVLKTLAEGVHHKAEMGGVHVNLASADAVSDAYDDLAERLSAAGAGGNNGRPGLRNGTWRRQ